MFERLWRCNPALMDSDLAAHTDARHAVFPDWLRTSLEIGNVPRGKWTIIGDDLIGYLKCGSVSYVFIWKKGGFCTHFPCTRQQLEEKVLLPRLRVKGWSALWRLSQAGKREVLAYLGLVKAPAAITAIGRAYANGH